MIIDDNRPVMVTIRCITFNQAPYIRQCLDGFVMQKTNFRFEAIVHDDASTDGTADIVREYSEKYPDIIRPIIETENQFTIGGFQQINKMIDPLIRGKYLADCEGDDYWIDPLKLQKQVDYMESHPQCTMTCNRSKLYSVKEGKYIGEQYCRKGDGVLNPVDVIYRTGLYISTCSILYRSFIKDNYPDYCIKCKVGDYPLQIMAAMKGEIYYFDDVMSVYRVDNSMSWMGQQQWGTISKDRIEVIKSQVEMFRGFSRDFPQYASVFINKIAQHINCGIPNRHNSRMIIDNYLSFFKKEISGYTLRWKMDMIIQKLRIPLLRRFYIRFFLRDFHQFKKFY